MARPEAPVVVELAPLEPRLCGPACVCLPAGATLATALETLKIRLPDGWAAGIWGRPAASDRVLATGDRIEFTRPLEADPKTARRARARRKASSRAGPVPGGRDS